MNGILRSWSLRMWLFLCAVVLFASPVSAKHPITHEDVWLMRRLGTPVLSPDGNWVVVSVTEPSYESDETVRDL